MVELHRSVLNEMTESETESVSLQHLKVCEDFKPT